MQAFLAMGGFSFLIALLFFYQTIKIPKESKALEQAQKNLKEAQDKLFLQEKMASIGILAAGISHEIKNPLNFITNFSDLTLELLEELKKDVISLEKSDPATLQNITDTISDISSNCKKINEHGKRAESIIKNMLIQARTTSVEKTPIDINRLLEEFLNLSYHGMRGLNNKFNVKIEKNLDKDIKPISANQQSIGRLFLNISNNGMYAANEKAVNMDSNFMPTISVSTSQNEQYIIIKIKDNGNGIPEELRSKIFEPFFTTKPPGEGTGLGLPICYDIVVKEHGGKLDINTIKGEFTEFIIMLPKNQSN